MRNTPLPRQTMSIRTVRAEPLLFKTFLSIIHVFYTDLHGHRSHSVFENMVVFLVPLPQCTVGGGGWVRGYNCVVKLPKTRSERFNDLWNPTPQHSFSTFFPSFNALYRRGSILIHHKNSRGFWLGHVRLRTSPPKALKSRGVRRFPVRLRGGEFTTVKRWRSPTRRGPFQIAFAFCP